MAIRVHEFMTLDGVIDTPAWTADFGFTPEMGETIGAVMAPARALLLGRVTYEMFEPAWSARTAQDDPGAPFFNDSVKHVVSSTLTSTTWRNSELLGAYDPDAIRTLRERVDGDLYVSGSGTLVRALLADGLADSLHLFVYPLTRPGGPRLFADGDPPARFSLGDSRAYDNGVVYLEYRTGG